MDHQPRMTNHYRSTLAKNGERMTMTTEQLLQIARREPEDDPQLPPSNKFNPTPTPETRAYLLGHVRR
jgi:hypothetical protein